MLKTNLLNNFGFEQSTVPNLTPSWSGNGKTETIGHSFSGDTNVLLTYSQNIAQTLSNLKPDTTYTFSAIFKIIDSPQVGGGTIDVSLTGQTTKKFNIQHMVHDHYAYYAYDFDWKFPTIYPIDPQLKITFLPNNPNAQLKIDMISIKEA